MFNPWQNLFPMMFNPNRNNAPLSFPPSQHFNSQPDQPMNFQPNFSPFPMFPPAQPFPNQNSFFNNPFIPPFVQPPIPTPEPPQPPPPPPAKVSEVIQSFLVIYSMDFKYYFLLIFRIGPNKMVYILKVFPHYKIFLLIFCLYRTRVARSICRRKGF